MTYVTAPPPAPPQDPKAVSMWQEIVSHMELERANYTTASASKKEIDWAIQNARVVLQCLQLRANQVSRDESMARNIQCILDQPPQAKAVVGRHNGHVMPANLGREPSMGSYLRKALGDSMVTFGFAFNQGSFQAIDMGKGLRNFTVAA